MKRATDKRTQKAKAKWAPLIEDLDKGMGIPQVAKKHKQKCDSLYRHLRTHGLLDRYKLKQMAGGYPPEIRARARTLSRQGKTVREIAQELGVGKSSVQVWVKNGKAGNDI